MGHSSRRLRGTRSVQRTLGTLAAVGLCAAGTAAPAAAATTHLGSGGSTSASRTQLAADTGECKFGGNNIKTTPWSLQRILLNQLWAKYRGKGVTVAVVDTGIDKGNPQLKDAIQGGESFVHADETSDTVGHGTEVAGIIAARKIPGTGFTGIAPEAKVIPLQYTAAGEGSSGGGKHVGNAGTLAQAINKAATTSAKIINISSDTKGKKDNAALDAAIRNAVSHNKLIVAAAGNDGADGKLTNTYPASLPGVLAVGASDRNNDRAYFSQSGHFVDIAAPGVGMVSTVPKGGQCTVDGTSFAAPYVAGVAALLWQKYPKWTADEIAARMEQTANRPGTGPDAQLGWGVVDPLAALTSDAAPQTQAHPDKQQLTGHVTPMHVTLGEGPEGRAKRYSVYAMIGGTVLSLMVAGIAVAVRDNRRKHGLAPDGPDAASTTTTSRNH